MYIHVCIYAYAYTIKIKGCKYFIHEGTLVYLLLIKLEKLEAVLLNPFLIAHYNVKTYQRKQPKKTKFFNKYYTRTNTLFLHRV